MPYAIGPFRSRIILPDIDFSDDELYYILLHEYCHIKRHDLLKNFLLQILFCLIWWIPFHSLAMKDFQQILEIRCDRSVTKRMSREEVCSYMDMMISCLKKIPRHRRPLPRRQQESPEEISYTAAPLTASGLCFLSVPPAGILPAAPVSV